MNSAIKNFLIVIVRKMSRGIKQKLLKRQKQTVWTHSLGIASQPKTGNFLSQEEVGGIGKINTSWSHANISIQNHYSEMSFI